MHRLNCGNASWVVNEASKQQQQCDGTGPAVIQALSQHQMLADGHQQAIIMLTASLLPS
jgi:hypothetical protein